ncbi:MAG: thiamine phosphate synthase [Lishizhenia sp.]
MLVVFSSEEKIHHEAQIINRLFDAGLERFHLRKPNHTREEYEQLILSIDKAYYPKISLHQFHDLVDFYQLGGKHFRKKDGRNFPENTETCFTSTGSHSVEEFISKSHMFDYLFISPVTNSISKPGYSTNENLNLSNLAENILNKAFALGGVCENTISEIRQLNYRNFAVLGAIWQKGDPLENFKNLNQIIGNCAL